MTKHLAYSGFSKILTESDYGETRVRIPLGSPYA
jgi:hypothetical protein